MTAKTATKRATIVEAMDGIFRPWFPGDTWGGWKAVLKAMDALPMTGEEIDFFKSIAGGREPPTKRVSELTAVCARRTGKDSIASLVGAYASATFDQQDRLRPGERAQVLCLACDRDQAKIVLNYIRSYFQSIPALAAMVERETKDGFALNNGVDIVVATNSFRAVRGKPILLVIIDEAAFMASDTSANPDTELYAALRPGMLTLPSSRIIIISSPYRKSGLLWDRYRKFFGKNDDNTLVIQAAVRELNPTISQETIDLETAEDPAAAVSELQGQFRNDIEAFVNRDAVEACVIQGRFELPPMKNVSYRAFCDPSGGSSDSMTLAIAHREGDKAVLDAIREARPPFSPEAVTAEFSALLRAYGIKKVEGDRYAGQWPRERFEVHGITYEASAKPKSELYLELLPLVNGARAELLDHPKLVSQLCALERRVSRAGKDSIDHPKNGHDDVINCAAGALTGLILQEWDSGSTFWAVFQMEKQAALGIGHPNDSPFIDRSPPTPVAKEWAKGSVEWERQQRGEIGPPPQNDKPAIKRAAPAPNSDELWNQKLKTAGLVG